MNACSRRGDRTPSRRDGQSSLQAGSSSQRAGKGRRGGRQKLSSPKRSGAKLFDSMRERSKVSMGPWRRGDVPLVMPRNQRAPAGRAARSSVSQPQSTAVTSVRADVRHEITTEHDSGSAIRSHVRSEETAGMARFDSVNRGRANEPAASHQARLARPSSSRGARAIDISQLRMPDRLEQRRAVGVRGGGASRAGFRRDASVLIEQGTPSCMPSRCGRPRSRSPELVGGAGDCTSCSPCAVS